MAAGQEGHVGPFEWDAGNLEKCGKHGLAREAIERMLAGDPTVYADPSTVEPRFRAVGRTEDGRYALVVFTLRERDGRTLLRPISARYMHRKEVLSYEQAAPAPPA